MKLSDGAVVPGNADIDAAGRCYRVENFHAPYHRAISNAVDAALAAGIAPALISIHSFTPSWKGKPRPWHAGILWDRDKRLAAPMLAGLAAMDSIVVGDNEPYSGALEGDTMSTHATARELAHVLIEIRQDLIGHKSGVDEWAGRLARVIEPIMNDPAIRRIAHH
ncbi:MAG TPA: N-formylglutamate amidohydrolase [Aestuariivirga sp.]|nr:N-formylglutamate amidohydrolase [Aestuariivirga sp.]